ncbi:MAG: ABC transporter ATP-binding protein [Hyphomicrobiaceae bacterium]|nr:MAG: ABC transporter ATP-binding protein [Hyphomicrobiaceae bacterium]
MRSLPLAISGVSKVFDGPSGRITAIDGVDLSIAPSEIVSIVGPSGCGKSTLLRMVAGFDTPSSGDILLGGQRIKAPGADRGIVFQQPQLYPWLNVSENVVFGPRMRGVPRASYADAAVRYIEAVGLSGFEKHYPYQLSGGMRQRVQIARVLINEPTILLMDEPFGALDYQTRLEMQKLLLDLCGELAPTVLFITHDIDEAVFISDRIYVMSRRPGRIAETLDVPLPRPRIYEEATASDVFVQLKLRVLKSLQH